MGQSITFTVDASQAGEGTLELVVTTAKSSVKADVRARSRGLYDVTFSPNEGLALSARFYRVLPNFIEFYLVFYAFFNKLKFALVQFTAVAHFVNITFNDEDVPGSPFKCEIDAGDASSMGAAAASATSAAAAAGLALDAAVGAGANRLATARGDGLKEVVLGAPAFFQVRATLLLLRISFLLASGVDRWR